MAKAIHRIGRSVAYSPLGIIALFIGLVHAVAGLVLGVSTGQLDIRIQIIIVVFLVAFPPIVLAVFVWLIIHHHTKLYAPLDFRTDEAFLQLQSTDEQRARLSAEVIAEQQSQSVQAGEESPDGPAKPGKGSLERLKEAFLLREELAMRAIEDEFGRPIKRHIRLPSGALVDGVFEHQGTMRVVEVKATHSQTAAFAAVRGIQQLKQVRDGLSGASLLLALVVEDPDGDTVKSLRAFIETQAASHGILVEPRIYSTEELKHAYGVSSRET